MSQHFLAIDLGAESGRALLGTLRDETLTLAQIHRFPNVPVRLPDGLHWDILRLWSEIKDALALTARQLAAATFSVGIDTWGVDFGLLDRHGALIGNPYHYRDSRTELEPDHLCVFEVSGDYTMRLAFLEELKSMPFGAVWDYYCLRQNVPVGMAFMDAIKEYEVSELSKRG